MTTPRIPELPAALPRPSHQVRWRNPQHARDWGWEELFGPGPFEVVRTVEQKYRGLAAGLVLRTKIGEWEISNVWLAPAAETGRDKGSRRQMAG
jgi:hypothetical protein